MHQVCMQKKVKEDKVMRKSIRGTVINKNKVARVQAENAKTQMDSTGKLVFKDGASDPSTEAVARSPSVARSRPPLISCGPSRSARAHR